MSGMWRLIGGTIALVVAYFVVPIEADAENVLVRALVTGVGLVLATLIIVRQVRHQIQRNDSPLWSLALALVGGVLAFALADFIIAKAAPDEFVSLGTKLDALYFALTTLATVGYGDVHAEGQLARAAVSVQLVFNLVVLTTATSTFVTQLKARKSSERPQQP